MDDIRDKVLGSTKITPFQRRVYLALLDGPAGTTITYGELAKRIGCRSAQAIGQALRRNPFAPCCPVASFCSELFFRSWWLNKKCISL